MDARMQDGDEVQLYSASHKRWLSLEETPMSALRGRVTIRGHRDRKFCVVESSRLKCSRPSKHGAYIEIKDAGWGGRVGLISNGKLCSDTPGGIRCDGNAHGHIGGWEAFKFESAGDGKVNLKGGRGKYCSDHHDENGVICDRDHPQGWEEFDIQTEGSLGQVLLQTSDPHRAATFKVGRASITSNAVTLQCKGHGTYLSVNPHNKVGCFSDSPTRLEFHRPDGQQWWAAGKGAFRDPASGKYFKAEGAQWGDHVDATGTSPGGWQMFDIQLVGGHEVVYPMVRGVNLGSWFLLEKWMVQRMFTDDDGSSFSDSCANIDEHGLMSHLRPSTKRRRMEAHWGSWITEDDIAWMHEHGLNTVRVPFGYWITHPEHPFIDGAFKYLVKLFEWCERHHIAVLLDFHGLKGSQNGHFTSGNCGACGKQQCGTTWKRFLDYEDTNLGVIRNLSRHFAKSPSYYGFGLANEVGCCNSKEVMAFYQKAYDIVRESSTDVLVFFDSTYNPATYPFRREQAVAQDDHVYFSARWREGADREHGSNLAKARDRLMSIPRWPVVVGEWALNHHGHDLSGVNDRAAWLRYFGRAQLQAYEQHTVGWIYWSYKTDYHASTWNYRHLCENGYLPGCTPSLRYATDQWWGVHPCTFAYLDGAHMDAKCTQQQLLL